MGAMTVRGIAKIGIPVRDQLRARDFWVDTMGFRVAVDLPYEAEGTRRWLEVEAPDGVRLVLGPADGEVPEAPVELPSQPYFFRADDIEATYAELSAKGVEFPQPPVRQPWGWWCLFNDSEGNRFALQES